MRLDTIRLHFSIALAALAFGLPAAAPACAESPVLVELFTDAGIGTLIRG